MSKNQSTTKKLWEKADPAPYMKQSRCGLDKELVREISQNKNEPEWMLQRRLDSLELFNNLPIPNWGPSE